MSVLRISLEWYHKFNDEKKISEQTIKSAKSAVITGYWVGYQVKTCAICSFRDANVASNCSTKLSTSRGLEMNTIKFNRC